MSFRGLKLRSFCIDKELYGLLSATCCLHQFPIIETCVYLLLVSERSSRVFLDTSFLINTFLSQMSWILLWSAFLNLRCISVPVFYSVLSHSWIHSQQKHSAASPCKHQPPLSRLEQALLSKILLKTSYVSIFPTTHNESLGSCCLLKQKENLQHIIPLIKWNIIVLKMGVVLFF